MICTHLRELYQLCESQQLKLSSSDLIHVVCLQCNQQEVCPSTLTDEYDAAQPSEGTKDDSQKHAAE